MRAPLLLGLLGAVTGVAVACGGSSGASTLSPSNLPTITGVTLSVNPPGVGSTVQAAATAALSNGTSAPLTSGFSSDAAAVATTTGAGAVTGVSIGDVTIAVDYQGFHAAKKVRVLPSYNGTFYGAYTIDSCTATAAFAEGAFCSSFSAGMVLQIGLNNAQSADLTSLTGQFLLGTVLGTSTGTISSSGDLTYAGAFVSGTARMDFRNFTGSSPSVGHISGHFEQVWTDSTITGAGVLSCTIQDLARTSGGMFTSSVPLAETPSSLAQRIAAVRAAVRR